VHRGRSRKFTENNTSNLVLADRAKFTVKVALLHFLPSHLDFGPKLVVEQYFPSFLKVTAAVTVCSYNGPLLYGFNVYP